MPVYTDVPAVPAVPGSPFCAVTFGACHVPAVTVTVGVVVAKRNADLYVGVVLLAGCVRVHPPAGATNAFVLKL